MSKHLISDDPIVISQGSSNLYPGQIMRQVWAPSEAHVISAGYDHRGHEFTGQHHPGAGFRIVAGCRLFTIEQARTHWSKADGYVKSRVRLGCLGGDRHFGIWWRWGKDKRQVEKDLADINRAIDALEAEAKHRGWL